jgi:hypothetical protein
VSTKKLIAILGLAAVAVLAFSALAAGTALAKEPAWFVCEKGTAADEFKTHLCGASELEPGGKWILRELLAGETRPFSDKHKAGTTKKLVGELGAVKVVVECNEEDSEGLLIGGAPGLDEITEDLFLGCKVIEPTACTIAAELTLNVPLLTMLVWKNAVNEEALDLVVPEAQPFVTLILTGTGCPAALKEIKVINEVLAEVKPTCEMKEKPELVFPSPPLTKYWTGDPSSRVEHTITPLEVENPVTKEKKKAEFVETKTVELLGAFLDWAFEVCPSGGTL